MDTGNLNSDQKFIKYPFSLRNTEVKRLQMLFHVDFLSLKLKLIFQFFN